MTIHPATKRSLRPAPANDWRPVTIAVVGGSGSGKSWLAAQLEKELRPGCVRLCLDDFYLDRSHLTPARRLRINFDHPRSIEWGLFEQCLLDLLAGRSTEVPSYDFKTQTRSPLSIRVAPKAFIMVDGLWLLRRRVKHLFELSIFVDCSKTTRLARRLERDCASRGGREELVEAQFERFVEPMHNLHVLPQRTCSDIVLPERLGETEVAQLAEKIKALRERPQRSEPQERKPEAFQVARPSGGGCEPPSCKEARKLRPCPPFHPA